MKIVPKLLTLLIVGLIPSSAFAGGFVSSPGSVFVKTSYQSWVAEGVFAGEQQAEPGKVELGDHAPFDPNIGGVFRSQQYSITTSYVPFRRLELNLFLPFLQVSSFKDDSFDSESTGLGDLYVGAGYQILKFANLGTTFNLKTKIPLSEVNEDQLAIPLSTGQFDIMAEQQSTWAVKPAFHLTLRTLYRYRLPVSATRVHDFRDEAELGLEMAGSPIDTLWLKLGTSSLWTLGSEKLAEGFRHENEGDQIHDFYLGAYWNFGKFLPFAKGLAMDGLFNIPLAGQDYPRGITWNLGFAYSF